MPEWWKSHAKTLRPKALENPGVFAAWREMIRGQPAFKRLFFQLHTEAVRDAIDESKVGRYGAYIVNGSIVKAFGA